MHKSLPVRSAGKNTKAIPGCTILGPVSQSLLWKEPPLVKEVHLLSASLATARTSTDHFFFCPDFDEIDNTRGRFHKGT